MSSEQYDGDFHMILPSNVDAEGTAAKYTTRLQTSINLQNYEDWEFALTEVQFVDAIKTFTGTEEIRLVKNYSDLVVHKIEKTTITLSKDKLIKDKQDKVVYDDGPKEIYWYGLYDFFEAMSSDKMFADYFDIGYSTWEYKKVVILARGSTGNRASKLTLSPCLAWVLGFHDSVEQGLIDTNEPESDIEVSKRQKTLATSNILKEVTLETAPVNSKMIGKRKIWSNIRIDHEDPSLYWWKAEYTFDPWYHGSINLPKVTAREFIKAERYTDTRNLSHGLNDGIFDKPEFSRHHIQLKPNSRNTAKLVLEARPDPDKTKDGEILELGYRAASILGFNKNAIVLPRGKTVRLKAAHPPDYRRSIYSLYVYCNLCENMDVGNKRVPLLRNVAFNSRKFGDTISVIYNNPLYVSLKTRILDTIEVELKDDMGELIPFIEGKTTINLHFRRRR